MTKERGELSNGTGLAVQVGIGMGFGSNVESLPEGQKGTQAGRWCMQCKQVRELHLDCFSVLHGLGKK
jgi:hypothetical protein